VIPIDCGQHSEDRGQALPSTTSRGHGAGRRSSPDGFGGAGVSLTAEKLVGYMLAEFEKSGRLRIALFFVQLAVALPGAISVVVPDDHKVALYIVGVALLIAWWVLNDRYVRARSRAAKTSSDSCG
jgi:hypothetical protein